MIDASRAPITALLHEHLAWCCWQREDDLYPMLKARRPSLRQLDLRGMLEIACATGSLESRGGEGHEREYRRMK